MKILLFVLNEISLCMLDCVLKLGLLANSLNAVKMKFFANLSTKGNIKRGSLVVSTR